MFTYLFPCMQTYRNFCAFNSAYSLSHSKRLRSHQHRRYTYKKEHKFRPSSCQLKTLYANRHMSALLLAIQIYVKRCKLGCRSMHT